MTETTAAPAAASPKRPSTAVVDLLEPVMRGETEIGSIILHKPKGAALYDFRLPDIVGLKCKVLYELIPLISEPPLTEFEAENLDPGDLHAIGGHIRDFFMLKSERVMWEAMMTAAQSGD